MMAVRKACRCGEAAAGRGAGPGGSLSLCLQDRGAGLVAALPSLC